MKERGGTMTNLKILVSDYDQTFYLNDKDIEINKQAVERFREQGNLFVIATGRSYSDFLNKVNLYHISYDYVILNHGATLLDRDGHVFFNFAIPDEVVCKMEKDLCLDEAVSSFCCSKLDSRVDFMHHDLTKINVVYSSKEKSMMIYNLIQKKYAGDVHCYRIKENALEIISSKTSKAWAIHLLLEQLLVPACHVYTIGDGYSDIEMVRSFNGGAMVHSVAELKRVATKEYGSVSELIMDILGITI